MFIQIDFQNPQEIMTFSWQLSSIINMFEFKCRQNVTILVNKKIVTNNFFSLEILNKVNDFAIGFVIFLIFTYNCTGITDIKFGIFVHHIVWKIVEADGVLTFALFHLHQGFVIITIKHSERVNIISYLPWSFI